MTLKLSVLDQSPLTIDSTYAEALHNTQDLAQLADQLGYHRYWVAEHHNSRSFAGSTPEVLMGNLAAITKGIRIGSGGVMMTHYSPLKVAENFHMLESLYPGRIDLGIGRAPGADERTTAALQAGPKKFTLDAFPAQVQLTLDYFKNGFPEDHPFHGIYATPIPTSAPEAWLLGSGASSASIAAHLGLPFAQAHFISPEQAREAIAYYKDHFKPSAILKEPYVAMGVFALACDDEEAAAREARIRNIWVLDFLSGKGGPFPSPAAVDARTLTPEQNAMLEQIQQRGIVGTKDQVKERLDNMAALHGLDELIVVTITYDHQVRRRSYELLAEAYNLQKR